MDGLVRDLDDDQIVTCIYAVFDPGAQGCLQCPRNRLLIAGDAGMWHALGQTGLMLSAVWTAGFAVLAALFGHDSRPQI